MGSYDTAAVEPKWQREWERAGCHAVALHGGGVRYFVHDSAPFPNGSLHLGHVRTYVLGDMMARYQRSLGKAVLYHTGWDAFGLPVEMQAMRTGVPPGELVRESIETMTRQLRRIGISYQWSAVTSTADPACYRWTQWLFLQMFDAGLVERRTAPLHWCPECKTTLARLQVIDGGCWRCAEAVVERTSPQWYIDISRYARQLEAGLDRLDGWSDRVRAMLAGLLREDGRSAGRSRGGLDWLVSRQRSWGTPMPLIHCRSCGVVPVPEAELPVRVPEQLERRTEFVDTSCPSCRQPARRETDTLDCFFDDIWCFLQALVLHSDQPGFSRENLARGLPVDCCQSGVDTFYYFHLYRFLGCFLVERGLVDDAELIRGFVGNDMVLAAGRKMSTHHGNTICPDRIIDEFGADALRVALLSVGPHRPIEWSREQVVRARKFLDDVHVLVIAGRSEGRAPGPVSRAAGSLRHATDRALDRISRFVEHYRPQAALAELAELARRIERFAAPRLSVGRLGRLDAEQLNSVLEDFVLALRPFAPHLAEECWRALGHDDLACVQPWPSSAARPQLSAHRL